MKYILYCSYDFLMRSTYQTYYISPGRLWSLSGSACVCVCIICSDGIDTVCSTIHTNTPCHARVEGPLKERKYISTVFTTSVPVFSVLDNVFPEKKSYHNIGRMTPQNIGSYTIIIIILRFYTFNAHAPKKTLLYGFFVLFDEPTNRIMLYLFRMFLMEIQWWNFREEGHNNTSNGIARIFTFKWHNMCSCRIVRMISFCVRMFYIMQYFKYFIVYDVPTHA